MKYNLSNILFTYLRNTAGLALIMLFHVNPVLFGQSQHYSIKIAPFSTRAYDEFSPVFYMGGIAFCSNQRDNSLIGYKDRIFKLYYTSKSNKSGWKDSRILAKELTTGFHDGPVTFNKDGTKLYYSRNNFIEKSLRNIIDTSNKPGIYSAELVNGIWTNIKPFTYNNPQYFFSTPAYTPDGQRIYFSSDMPGGFGGMDLYYCDMRGSDWDTPVNMGPVINTPGNESFPFADQYGKVFFASDGHKGLGGKDIYYTRQNNGNWVVPVHLDSAINSVADDFALIMDSTSRSGYFSSNRLKSDDIFSFSTMPEEFTHCDTLRENNFCFTFYDERYQLIDTLPVIYRWDFGNGIIRTGAEVKHCFPGPGNYVVRLNITDELTGEAITEQVEYKVELDNYEQAYINSNNIGLINQPLAFDALESNFKDLIITDYSWDVGDGFTPGGPVMNKTFEKKGEYTVRLGLLTKEISSDLIQKTCVTKKIRIYDEYQELPLPKNDTASELNSTMQIRILLMDDLSKMQKTRIEEAFDETVWSVKFDKYGIMPDSYPFLDIAVAILKNNPEIRLELALYVPEGKMPPDSTKISDQYLQELGFYFRNKGVDINISHSRGAGLSHLPVQPNIHENNSTEGIIEFIYMKKYSNR